ncbi:MAG: glycosyltransferase family 39 protein [Candidatus Eremiobacteraeota bacterium]|nr:glycosyltransferase family 39 protein [Candidatus Eremiobacteraeota bacterium]
MIVSKPWVRLGGVLALGFLIRLFFIPNLGFKNDIDAFEAWALSLGSLPFSEFYAKAGFADYPPGYFYILAFIGRIYTQLHLNDPGLSVLRATVKMPAILFDLVDGYIIFLVVRRFFSETWALLCAALFVLNPAVIFISAAWGQVDSISGGLALLAIYLLLRSDDETGSFSWDIVLAWIALSYSLLIKPQGAILVPLVLAFAFVDPQRRQRRLYATLGGIAGGLLLALILTLPFHPIANPVNAFAWLYQKYAFGKGVYPYNSINAFNLWSIRLQFWEQDNQKLVIMSQAAWGVLLLVAASILIIVRYLQVRTARALVESAALLTLAFFMLSTRMHERYIFDGLLLTIVAAPFARQYLYATAFFSITLLVNLWYSWQYITALVNHLAVDNARDMYPLITHPLSLLNVAAFFALCFFYFGQEPEEQAAATTERDPAALSDARNWFAPREGLTRMLWPLDYVVSAAIGLFSFVLSYVNYWKPPDKIFDEIYFARAAEEYLQHRYIYESTHPPLTKLIITLSTIMFGGLHGGDNAYGWRFLDVVFGAVAVVVLYAFAKRITGSTLFSGIAALLFTFDGMHFVQSRIATPEGIVVVFSLGALYAFYRFWIASQSTQRLNETSRRPMRIGISAAVAIAAGFVLSAILNVPTHQSSGALIVAGTYFAFGFYLLMRVVVMPRVFPSDEQFASYPEGTIVVRNGDRVWLRTPDGGVLDSGRKTPVLGAVARANQGSLVYKEDDVTATYKRDATLAYATPAGAAVYQPGAIFEGGSVAQNGSHGTAWLVAFTVLLGMLVASKWYGVMAYPVSIIVIAFVWTQRYRREGRLKLWGNPNGFRLDVDLATIVFLSMTVYAMVWIPDAIRHIFGEVQSFSDLVKRQYDMFHYHDTLVATHPYASQWWQWPLDLRPIAYYFKDLTGVPFGSIPSKCCVVEIISLPNPLIMWFGVFSVPIVGYLAWRERNKGYSLLVLAYLLQWLPWMRSPRITFAYHFYVDIPIIVLCNAIVLQRIWNWRGATDAGRTAARIAVGAYVLAVALAFIFFYPILAGVPVPYNVWNARMLHPLLGNGWI